MTRALFPLLCLVSFWSCTCASATAVSGTIATDTTWTAAASPYVLQGDLNLNAGVVLRLQPGVELVAAGDYRIFVNGTLTANGTAVAPILLRALDPAQRGVWQGLYVPAGGHCTLEHTTVQNAVNNIMAPGGWLSLTNTTLRLASEHGLYAWNAALIQIADSTCSDNSGRGLYVEGYQATGEVRRSRFERNGGYPVYLKATVAEILKGANTYVDNGLQRIGLSCSMAEDLLDDDTWTRQAVPFELGAGSGDTTLTITPGGSLTIPAGTTLLARAIDCRGTLQALGESGARTRFTALSATPAPGAWEGLTFRAGATCDLRFVDLEFARTAVTADAPASLVLWGCNVSDSKFDGVTLTGRTPLSIRRCSFTRCGRNGVRLAGPGSSGILDECLFTANTGHPVWTLAQNLRLLKTKNHYSANTLERLGVSCGAAVDLPGGSHLWYSQHLPLDLSVNPADSLLTIGPAATLTLKADQTLYSGGIIVRGTLNVTAGLTAPCRFLPPGTLTPGAWNGITFDGGTGLLDGALIQYATTAVTLNNASPTITECTLQYSQDDGLRCRGTSSPVVTRSAIVGNGRHGVLIENTAAPNLGRLDNASTSDNGRNTLRDNAEYEIYNNTSGTIRAEGNAWYSTDSAAINARLFDKQDLSTLGAVDFLPLWAVAPNIPPTLSWPALAGYSDNGLSPEVGQPTTTFRFRVRYLDADGEVPRFVRLHLARAGVEVDGSPFSMVAPAGADYAAGAVFAVDCSLPGGRDHTYWFSASDGRDAAAGPPCAVHSGPLVTTRPTLSWAGTAGYQADGVSPDAGPAGASFQFRVKYSDPDHDAPRFVRCHLLRNGQPVAGSPFAMGLLTGTDFAAGKVYKVTRRLTETGSYTCFFEATDGVLKAVGPPRQSHPGPVLTAGAAGIVSLRAEEIGQGAVHVAWQQAGEGWLRAEVRNLAGRLLACQQPAGAYAPGAHSLRWNSRTASGFQVPRGTYLVVLTLDSGDGRRHTQMVPLLLK